MRKRLAVITVLITICLCSCTVEADRIYVICRYDNGAVSCYKDTDNFYTVTEDGELLPSIDPTLRPYPALHFNPEEGCYNLSETVPHLYTGTLKELEHYVYYLLNNGAVLFEIMYSDYQRLEMYVYFPDDTYRILYNVYGEIRIYSQNALPILYLDGDKIMKE